MNTKESYSVPVLEPRETLSTITEGDEIVISGVLFRD